VRATETETPEILSNTVARRLKISSGHCGMIAMQGANPCPHNNY